MIEDYEKLDTEAKPRSASRKFLIAIAKLSLVGVIFFTCQQTRAIQLTSTTLTPQCPLAPYVRPDSYAVDNSTLVKIMHDETFRNQSAAKLSGAVRVKTVVNDDSPTPEEDPEFWSQRFGLFHEYLEKTFPEVWKFCKVEKVNKWGLVITWEGSESSLKPVMLTAHQDTTPIQDATRDQWSYPPFEGAYDGDLLYGRGSADCKNLLVGLLETAEELYSSGFKPRRSIIFAFGFDEEIGGHYGANPIGAFLTERYGKNGLYAVVDEGGQSLIKEGGVALALIGTAEKGMLNFYAGINAPGGHSSVPPDHTSIGMISELITRFENDPFKPVFTPRNPTFYEYQCLAEHSNSLPSDIKHAILNAGDESSASYRVADYIYNSDLGSRYLVTTSQAVDVINGGGKSNALPEYVEVVVNHRIAVESTVKSVFDRDLNHVKAVAEMFDLGIVLDGVEIKKKTAKGYFTVRLAWELEPAPFTPIYDAHWDIFVGTVRHVYEEVCKGTMKDFEGMTVVPAPGMATGNTDTQHYWNLTEHIYRYRPGLTTSVEAHAHGTDEHIPFNSHLQIIAFYYEYLQAIDSLEV